MKFWEFTKAIGKPLVGMFLFLLLFLTALGGAMYLNKFECLIKNPINIELLISVILMIYFHELGHYIPLRNSEIEVQRTGIGITISTTASIPFSAVFLSALLPLAIALVFTVISKNLVFIYLWFGIGAAALVDAIGVMQGVKS